MMSRRASTTDMFGPLILVPSLTTQFDETPSWLSLDQCRLYFESSRTNDQYDLFVAERDPT